MVLREEMYFEPRTISPGGSIRWFGATYSADPMLCHTEQTVYIRDNGKMQETVYHDVHGQLHRGKLGRDNQGNHS